MRRSSVKHAKVRDATRSPHDYSFRVWTGCAHVVDAKNATNDFRAVTCRHTGCKSLVAEWMNSFNRGRT